MSEPAESIIDNCDGCEYETSDLHETEDFGEGGGPLEVQKWKFCEICYCTFVGNSARYPSQYPDREVLRTIAYIGNMILAAIGKDGEQQ